MPRRYGAITVRQEEEEQRLLDVAHCDHYAHDDDNDSGGGSRGGLTPVANTRRRKGTRNSKTSKLKIINCCGGGCSKSQLLLVPLFLLAFISLFYSYKLQHELAAVSTSLDSANIDILALASTLRTESANLLAMNATLTNHSAVIARFSDSVSNGDVLRKLDELVEISQKREEAVRYEMESTKRQINAVLNTTKAEIDVTVADATNQINFQVASVQSKLSSYIRTTQDQFSTENSFMIYQLAGTFTMLGCLISMWHMTSHLRNFNQPFVQRKILAILWMCPIYSVTSWLSLVLPKLEGYLAILKDLYEAYVIYQFLSFCIAVLGKGDRGAVVDLLAKHADHLRPTKCCGGGRRSGVGPGTGTDTGNELSSLENNKQLAEDVLFQCQVCAAQFVFLRPMLTATLFVLKKVDYNGPLFGPGSPFDPNGSMEEERNLGMLDYRSPQFYIVILENVSVFLAFSGLLKFYHAVQEDLSWCRPFPKFLCIKGVVFMTFWQGIGISLLANTTDLLENGDGNDEDQVETWAKQGQNFLICLEMLGFAIAHFYCFPVEEWVEGYRPVEDKSKFGDKLALGDFVHDLKTILRHKEKKKRIAKEKLGLKHSDDSISTVLEEDEELGRTDSNDGLQSLLENVEDLLESGGGDDVSSNSTTSKKRKNDTPPVPTPPRTHENSIEQSLRDRNAPRELRQATALLLAGNLLDETTARLLTSDILDLPLEVGQSTAGVNNDDEGGGRVEEDVGKEKSQQSQEDTDGLEGGVASTESLEGGDAVASSDADAPTADTQPSKSTSLLPASKIDEMLRPSIFTMHSMDEDLGGKETTQSSEGLDDCGETAGAESLKGDDATSESDAQPRESTSLWAGVTTPTRGASPS
mmetsp:Transcript_16014/g.28881  ORF Transcript_16014/g.28881 Transcript_16014/m.28881 type:complete len:868 (-) Transcript_16014:109-2712(-)|eukprot:CAMPEP_0196131816 /NCGR_PEP_ID=MMETSP0910-20130528/1667_1 /TAXON_ID=49265 /ORGANISM="Thalassiosira rotula, Strain GSO102" /LENGTH=867 /DNA_ID=CAMNT_0041391329 /DNA_START=69 /DNA_END=2672 /DNA_ORIENTATION=-